jgi:hypothetical protein
VRVVPGANGALTAVLDGETLREDVDVWDYPIRRHLKLGGDMPEVINLGESALSHLYLLASNAKLGLKIKVPFRYAEVSMVRIYELEPGSRFHKFGGTVLFEAFDRRGRSLGKMLRSLLVARCVPVADAAK